MPTTTWISQNEFCEPVSAQELNELLREVNKIFKNKFRLREVQVEVGYWWWSKKRPAYYLYYELQKGKWKEIHPVEGFGAEQREYQIINLGGNSKEIIESHLYGILNGYYYGKKQSTTNKTNKNNYLP